MALHDILQDYSSSEILWYYIPKILIATLCGGLVGLEREMKHKVAGMKTNIMICVGSAIFAATALMIYEVLPEGHGEPTKIIAGILSGIGFLGAGAIFRSHERIRGLTSAALIWVLSAIGIMIATGAYTVSIILTIGLIVMMVVFGKFEERFIRHEDHEDAAD